MMAVSPDLGVAGNVLVFMICTMNWYNGLIVPYNQMQVFWRYWVCRVDFITSRVLLTSLSSSTTSTPSPTLLVAY